MYRGVAWIYRFLRNLVKKGNSAVSLYEIGMKVGVRTIFTDAEVLIKGLVEGKIEPEDAAKWWEGAKKDFREYMDLQIESLLSHTDEVVYSAIKEVKKKSK